MAQNPPPGTTASQAGRVAAIDGLRGLAALAVVLFHFLGLIPLLGIAVGPVGDALVAVTRYGYLGVPIFFVLSGQVIALTGSRYTFTPGVGSRFVARRMARLVPPYWAAVLLHVTVLAAGHLVGFFRNTEFTAGQVAAHLLYVQNLLGFPALDVAYWTLCLEVQFYVVFAVSAALLHRAPPGLRLAWFAALTLGSLGFDLTVGPNNAWFYCLWYQFGAGILAFEATRSRAALGLLAALLPALLGLGVALGRPEDLTVFGTVVILVLAAQGARLAWLRSAPILALGKISYSLYLIHGLFGLMLGVVFRSLGVRSEPLVWLTLAGATLAAIAFAAGFYRVFERLGLDWSHRIRVEPQRGRSPRPLRVPPLAPEPVLQDGKESS